METAATLFERAAQLIERGLIQLDATEAACDCCGGKRFANLIEHRVYDALTDTPDKLRRAVEKLGDGSKAPVQR
jgi:hypothetical protein